MAAAKKSQHLGFKKLENKLAHQPGVTNPGAIAAAVGREKYGDAKMAKMAAQGRAKAAIKKARKGY